MNRAIQCFLIALAVAASFAVAVVTVFAHADYESSVPDRDEVVPESPERVEVFFTQEVVKREGIYFVRVFDETGTQVSDGDGVVNDDNRSNINAELPAPLEPGRYVVEWMTTSDIDGDTEEGAFCFYVAVEPTEEQRAECAEFGEDVAPTPTQANGDPTEPALTPDDGQPTDVLPTDVPPVDGADDGGGTDAGLIVGIVAAVIVAAGLIAGGFVWISRRG